MEPFTLSDFNIEKIVLACYVGKGMGMAVHRHRPSHGLALHTSGTKRYTFENGKILTVNQNDLIYLPKYSNYEVTCLQDGDCYAINFDISQDAVFAPFTCRIRNSASMLDFFKNAKAVWESRKDGYTLKCKADLYNIIYLMQQEYLQDYIPESKKRLILPALEYIHEHYAGEVLSVAHLAGLCSVSPEYFRAIFKSIYGVSPKNYITNLKIQRAKELLSSGMYSVTETAFLSGYTDLSHFSREFKKAAGISPKQFLQVK